MISRPVLEADLSGVALRGASLNYVSMQATILTNLDLHQVKDLETVKHLGPSDIGIQTFYLSCGEIPQVFLRGAGVPDDFIKYMRSLAGRTIEYCSCFISYSSQDDAFARRLYEGLQSNNVRCWFAPEDYLGARARSFALASTKPFASMRSCYWSCQRSQWQAIGSSRR